MSLNARQVDIYGTLNKRTIAAMRRSIRRGYYDPRGDLLVRISREFNISIDGARSDLMMIRQEIFNRTQ